MSTKYLRGAGTGNWNTDASWSTTSSAGTANTTKPVAADAVILDAGSATTCTVDVSNQACTSIVCTGYTGTLTFTTLNLTTTGTVTLVAGMTVNVGTTATWNMGCAAVAFTPGGKTLGNVNFNVAGTLTITGGVMACGSLAVATGVTATLASNSINISNGLTVTGTGIITGQTLNLSGGTWSGTSTGSIKSNLTITSTVTISGSVYYGTGTLTTSGSTITSSSGVVNINASCTITDSGASTPNWAALTVSCSATSTLTLSQATVVLNLNAAIGATLTLATSNITVKSSINTNSTGIITGQTITMDGSGASPTWQATGWTTGYVASNLTITAAVTISGNVSYRTGTITTSAATITWSSATFNVSGSCTLTDNNANTPNWAGGTINTPGGNNTLTLSQATTILNMTLVGSNQTLTLASNSLIINGNLTFNTTATGFLLAGQTVTMTGASGTAALSSIGAAPGRITSNLIFLAGSNTITITTTAVLLFGATTATTITYTSGNIVTTNSTIGLYTGVTLATNGITWNNFNCYSSGSPTIVLTTALTCTGTFTISQSTTFSGSYSVTVGSISQGAFTLTTVYWFTCTGNYVNTGDSIINGVGYGIFIGGNLTLNYPMSGTGTVHMNGTGTWTAASSACILSSRLSIENPAVTFTISGTVYYNNANLDWYYGAISATGSTIKFNSNCSIYINSSTLGDFILGTVIISYNVSLTITSATGNNSVFSDLIMYYLSSLTIPQLQTLTVSNSMLLDSCSINTNGSVSNLSYNGTSANCKAAYVTVSNITAINAINIWNAGTLLNTININNRTNPVNTYIIE